MNTTQRTTVIYHIINSRGTSFSVLSMLHTSESMLSTKSLEEQKTSPGRVEGPF